MPHRNRRLLPFTSLFHCALRVQSAHRKIDIIPYLRNLASWDMGNHHSWNSAVGGHTYSRGLSQECTTNIYLQHSVVANWPLYLYLHVLIYMLSLFDDTLKVNECYCYNFDPNTKRTIIRNWCSDICLVHSHNFLKSKVVCVQWNVYSLFIQLIVQLSFAR